MSFPTQGVDGTFSESWRSRLWSISCFFSPNFFRTLLSGGHLGPKRIGHQMKSMGSSVSQILFLVRTQVYITGSEIPKGVADRDQKQFASAGEIALGNLSLRNSTEEVFGFWSPALLPGKTTRLDHAYYLVGKTMAPFFGTVHQRISKSVCRTKSITLHLTVG